MPGWTLVDTHSTQGRTFQRPLGAYELAFYWDGVFNGIADSLQYFHLRLSNGARDARLFSEDNIARAWVSTKRRYPLSGASIVQGAADSQILLGHGEDSGSNTEFRFVVRENDLSVVRPREIVFRQVSCAEDAQKRVIAILDGPRPLSDELLVQLYVFRETGFETENPDVLHLMILVAHCVTDGMANRTFSRCLLDTLARGTSDNGSEPAQMPLEERLAMAIPPEALEPVRLAALSPAVRRWRRAAGAVIHRSRIATLQGGYTLPCHFTRAMPCIPARSRTVSTSLTTTQTTAVLASCRQHSLTFGAAYLVLAQVAMTRVLYRRYLRGDISEEEWEYRKRQPYIAPGPVNVRPYLDEVWSKNGGAGEFTSCVSFMFHQFPFMTLGEAGKGEHLHDGAPSFSDLLSFNRFLYRARLVKKRRDAFFGHPLFHEIVRACGEGYAEYTRLAALRQMQYSEMANSHDTHAAPDEVLPMTEMPMVWAHGGSSLGNVDLISPTEYPLPPTHPLSPDAPKPHPFKAGYSTSPSSVNTMPKVTVEASSVHLHAHPGELYLGAATSRGRMSMYVHYDLNVFEEGVINEWLDEVRGAVLCYLCNAESWYPPN